MSASAFVTSYQCRTGDHESCLRTWQGAVSQYNKVIQMICECECGHSPQKAAAKAVKESQKWLQRNGILLNGSATQDLSE